MTNQPKFAPASKATTKTAIDLFYLLHNEVKRCESISEKERDLLDVFLRYLILETAKPKNGDQKTAKKALT